MRVDLVMFCGQPIDVAGRVTQSDAKSFFDSKSFEGWKKSRDNDSKLLLAISNRLDVVIDGLNNIAKAR